MLSNHHHINREKNNMDGHMIDDSSNQYSNLNGDDEIENEVDEDVYDDFDDELPDDDVDDHDSCHFESNSKRKFELNASSSPSSAQKRICLTETSQTDD